MKTVISLLILIPAMALLNWNNPPIDPELDSLWLKVEELQKKGQPRAALAIVNDIIDLAEERRIDDHWIKGVQHKANFIAQLEESGDFKTMDFLQERIESADGPLKALLHLTLAEKMQFYVRNQFYRLNNRTETGSTLPEDKASWSTSHFEKAISHHFQEALADSEMLRDVRVKDFELIINTGENAIHLTPSLYEFMAHQVLNTLIDQGQLSMEGIATNPIDWNSLMIDHESFSAAISESAKTESRMHFTLYLFSELIQIQSASSITDPLLYTESRRLDLIKSKATADDIAATYEFQVKALLNQHQDSRESGIMANRLAVHYMDLAGQQEDKSKAGALRKRAHRILQQAIKNHPNSYGGQQCTNTKTALERPTLNFSIEKVIPENNAVLLKIEHKEIDGVKIRIGKLGKDDFIRFQNDHRYRKNIKNVFRDTDEKLNVQVSLTNKKNFTSYGTEWMTTGLESGIYLITMEDEANNILAHQVFHSTNLAYSHMTDGRSATSIFVFDRVNGNPLKDVDISLYAQQYGRSRGELVKIGSGRTDKNGTYVLDDVNQRSIMIELQLNNDVYFPYENIYINRSRHTPRTRIEATVLTDRAIYRPGQEIFWKAVVYEKDSKGIPALKLNQQVTVELVNPNGEIEATKVLMTNAFGSISGSFVAPDKGLNGQFNLRASGMGNQIVRIEEYKRPKFKVTLEIPDGKLTGGQDIEVPGYAKTFAGTALEETQVNYKVMRTVEYPFYWWRRPAGRESGSKLVAIGTTNTDKAGKFFIPFESFDEKPAKGYWRGIHVYRVTAEVIDENGEVRTDELSIRIGDQAFYVKTDIKEQLNIDGLDSILISTQNAMGEPVEAQLRVQLFSLNSPTAPAVDRLWDLPDFYLADRNEFSRSLPQLRYNSTNNYTDWEIGERVFNTAIKSEGEQSIAFTSRLPAGVYKLVVLDTTGQEVYQQFFSGYSFDQPAAITNTPLLVQADKNSYRPGDEVKLLMTSPFASADVLVVVEKDRQIISQKWHVLDGAKVISIPVIESDRGGFAIRIMHTVHNRMTNQQLLIKVPWTNKKLEISWESFRNVLLPGQEEKWRLKVSGPDKELVLAEVLASMYDASLDEFIGHQWAMDLFPTYYPQGFLSFGGVGLLRGHGQYLFPQRSQDQYRRIYPRWKYIGGGVMMGGVRQRFSKMENAMMRNSMEAEESAAPMMADDGNVDMAGAPPANDANTDASAKKDFSPRTNLRETVFFKPTLLTDNDGNVIVEFTMNEALTSWKLQLLAHTRDLKSTVYSSEVITQKDLMVFPQIPRFIRAGDTVTVSAKINRLTEDKIKGSAWLEIINALTKETITDQFVDETSKPFEFENENQLAIDWSVSIPSDFIQPLEFVIRAKAGKHTDGESNTIPVLTNQILITETMPISIRANERRSYNFDALAKMDNAGIQPHRFTLEFMENPVWFAVQSLPYLTDYPHLCTEQIAHKIYANAIAGHIIQQYPAIQDIFKQWADKDELISNLNKNPELKSALIEETPWLRDAASEEEQMKNIGLLFDFNRMAEDLNKNIEILLARQLGSGGFVWFSGGNANTYITQLVVEVFGHLRVLGVEIPRQAELDFAIQRALEFSLNKMRERYDRLTPDARKRKHLDPSSLHAIYVASFHAGASIDLDFAAWRYYYQNAKTNWVERSLYEQALLASAFYRFEDADYTTEIVASFKDRALRSEELGMYWKYDNGYQWYSRPIETQAHIMEALALVDSTSADLNEMRIWLLKHKQTNRWSSTVATAKAIYALLLRGEDWLGTTKPIYVKLGKEVISHPEKNINDTQGGTGYFKKSWTGDDIDKEMARVVVENENEIISWGAAYWQYFQSIDQVEKHSNNPLNISRGVFKKVQSSDGEILEPVSASQLRVGDRVTIRLEIQVDRMMEFIHLKDLRAAGFEPVDVLSGYRWRGGLHYYQSTTDLGTHFFIDRIQAGTYVLEYDAFAVNAGDYSGGLSTLQCMYAPEFASHSEGSRLSIDR